MQNDQLSHWMTYKKAETITNQSRSTLNRLIKTGKIRAVKNGRSVLIDGDSLNGYYSNLPPVNDRAEAK